MLPYPESKLQHQLKAQLPMQTLSSKPQQKKWNSSSDFRSLRPMVQTGGDHGVQYKFHFNYENCCFDQKPEQVIECIL
jgi:hypothetical protein